MPHPRPLLSESKPHRRDSYHNRVALPSFSAHSMRIVPDLFVRGPVISHKTPIHRGCLYSTGIADPGDFSEAMIEPAGYIVESPVRRMFLIQKDDLLYRR